MDELEAKRTMIAAMAMQGILASDTRQDFDYEEIAVFSVMQADALIKELEKDED